MGNFNSQSHKLVDGYDENTKYHIRKDFGMVLYIWILHITNFKFIILSFLDFAAWSNHNNGNTNDPACQNYGYRQLNGNGHYIDISSGGHFYDDNERCYWGIYAPGAQKLRFQLTNNLHVSDQNIFLSQD